MLPTLSWLKAHTIATLLIATMLTPCLVSVIPVGAVIPPNEVWVDDDYNASTPGWGTTHFDKIQDGINAVAEGGTVNVYPGTYHEAVIISKSVKVIGNDTDTTIIDGAGVTLSSPGLVKITATSGTVEFGGFTIKNAPPVGSKNVRVAIYTQAASGTPTYIIRDNKIYGTNDPNEDEDYGFYAYGGTENIIFQYNMITQTGANPLLLECHTGPTEISHNTLDPGVYGCDVIFFMTYNGNDVTTLQNVSYNTFNMDTGQFDYSHRSSAISFNIPGSAYGVNVAKFTNIVISGNTINNLKSHRRGISFWNNEAGNNIISPVIIGNFINGTGEDVSWGISFIGNITNPSAKANITEALIIYNTITNVDQGIFIRTADCTPGIKINYNNFGNNNIALNNTLGTETIDATYNWWGDATGPHHGTLNPGGTGDDVSDNVDFEPWLTAPVAAGSYQSGTDELLEFPELGVDVYVNGSATVYTATYGENPGASLTGDIGNYIDIYVPDVSELTELEIRLHYTDEDIIALGLDESSLRLYWWDGENWVACSDSGVNTVENYIWAKIRSDTTPSLNDLTGTPFAAAGAPLPPPVGGYVVPLNNMVILVSLMVLLSLAAAAAVAAFRIRWRP